MEILKTLDLPETPWDIAAAMLDEVQDQDPELLPYVSARIEARLLSAAKSLMDNTARSSNFPVPIPERAFQQLRHLQQAFSNLEGHFYRQDPRTPLDTVSWINQARSWLDLLKQTLLTLPFSIWASVTTERISMGAIGLQKSLQYANEFVPGWLQSTLKETSILAPAHTAWSLRLTHSAEELELTTSAPSTKYVKAFYTIYQLIGETLKETGTRADTTPYPGITPKDREISLCYLRPRNHELSMSRHSLMELISERVRDWSKINHISVHISKTGAP